VTFHHQPVLVQEVVSALLPALTAPGALLVDCTAGGGGHLAALWAAASPANPTLRAIALDRDPAALAAARARLDSLHGPAGPDLLHGPTDPDLLHGPTDLPGGACRFVHAGFAGLAEVLRATESPAPAAILADLGVSSHQLDTPARGFSFQADAPLDMRMDPSRGPTLAEALAGLSEPELTRILRDYGEEPDAHRIARAILAARPQTTGQLGEVVRAAMSAPRLRQIGLRIHPATRTFQALRIFLNDELGQLDGLLADAPALLARGGRLAIITFHSLEDRRVKQAFAARARAAQPPAGVPMAAADLPRPDYAVPHDLRHGATPGDAELAHNPRSRSSRLRVLERLSP